MEKEKAKCESCGNDKYVRSLYGKMLCSTCMTLWSSIKNHQQICCAAYKSIYGNDLPAEAADGAASVELEYYTDLLDKISIALGGVPAEEMVAAVKRLIADQEVPMEGGAQGEIDRLKAECDYNAGLFDKINIALETALGARYDPSCGTANAIRSLGKVAGQVQAEVDRLKAEVKRLKAEETGGEWEMCNPEECSDLPLALKALLDVQHEFERRGVVWVTESTAPLTIEAQARLVVDEVLALRGKVEHLQRELDGALAAGTMEPEAKAIDPDDHFHCPDGYGKLAGVLVGAIRQAAYGKGLVRHATAEPFERQTSLQIARNLGTVGSGFLLGQAAKKISESVRLDEDRAISELLGAIVYAAMAVLLLNERRKSGEKDLWWSGPSKDVWYVEGGGHD